MQTPSPEAEPVITRAGLSVCDASSRSVRRVPSLKGWPDPRNGEGGAKYEIHSEENDRI